MGRGKGDSTNPEENGVGQRNPCGMATMEGGKHEIKIDRKGGHIHGEGETLFNQLVYILCFYKYLLPFLL